MKIRFIRIHLLAALIFATAAGRLDAATYYIDFDGGNNSNSGTSVDQPWKHCPGDANATGTASNTVLAAGDTVIFKGGVHYRSTVVCNWSGTGSSRITYDGNTANTFGTGRAIIDGSQPFSGWTACTSASDAGGNTNWSYMYKVTIPATTDVLTANMYQGDQMLWPAQNPNITDPNYPDDLATFTAIYCDKVTRTSLTDTNVFIHADTNYYKGCILRLWGNPNQTRILSITNYIPAQNMIQFPDTGANSLYTNKTVYYAVVNNVLHIDQAGEYAVANGYMYLWPKAGNPNTNEISQSHRRIGINVNGKSNLNIRGFKIQKMTSGESETSAGCAVLDRFGASNVTVSDNEITKNYSGEKEGSIKMYATGTHGTNVVIEGNWIYENPHNPGMIVTFDDSIVRSNTLARNGATGIDFYGCQRSQLIFNTLTEHTGVHANGLTLYLGNKDCFVGYNTVFDGLIALTIKHATNITVAYNVLHTGVDSPTAIIWSDINNHSTNICFYNNTMINPSNVALGMSENCSFNLRVENNILDGCGIPATNLDVTGITNYNSISHNVYTKLANSQDERYGWSPGEGDVIATNTSLVFIDPAGRNFQLKTGSPAIDAGMDWGQTRDFSGNTQVGTAWDAGAYENLALLEITTTSPLVPGSAGTVYSQTITAAGGQPPYTWAKVSGTLPSGLGFTSSGVITGIPASVTSAVFNVQVTDSELSSVTNAFTLNIYEPLAITTANLPSGIAGVPYSTVLGASGGKTPYSWSLASGGLPPGLGLVGSGSITGTPEMVLTTNFSIRVTDDTGISVTNAFSMTVTADTNNVALHLRFDFGSTNYPTSGNWNNAISTNTGLVVTNAIDAYGAPRNIDLRLSEKLGNLTYLTGPISSNLYPSSAQRDSIASTKAFSYRIEGLSPSSKYSLTFFGARNTTTNTLTLYTVGGSNAVLDVWTNTDRTAVITDIAPDTNGWITFTVTTNTVSSGGYAYLSAIELKKIIPVCTLIYTADANGTISGAATQTVNQGSSGTAVSAVPDTGYHFVNWSDSVTDNPRTDQDVVTNISVTANFAINTYTLTYSAGMNGSISGTATQTVTHGSSGTAVTAVPDSGYEFVNWSDSSTVNPRTDADVTGNIIVTANFAATTNGGNLRVLFDFGSTTYLTTGNWNNANSTNLGLVVTNAVDTNGVQRNIGLRLSEKIGNLAYLTGPIVANLYPSSAQRDNIASTKAFSYRIEGANPASRYRLTFFASRNSTTNALTLYTVGTSNVVLDAWTNSGRSAVIENVQPDTNGWITFTVNTNTVSSGGYGFLSVLDLEETVTVNHTLTYTAGANGSISGTATQTVTHGGNGAAVMATANAGYHFINWSDSSTDNPRTDTNVTGDISVTANFAINTYTLTYAAGANGTINGTATQTVDHGLSGTAVTAVPNAGYEFVSWSDSVADNPRMDQNVVADISVTANFVQSSPGFWVTEYYLTTNQFTSTNYSLTLNQALADDYFVLIRGSRIGDSISDPDNNSVSVAAVPGGRGDLPDSGASNVIKLVRHVADFTWEGVITVVECMNSTSPDGFKLRDIMNTSLTSVTGSDTCSTAWGNINQVVPFGGYCGGGAKFNANATSNAQVTSVYVSLHPSGSNTVNWVRDAGGQTLVDASMTTFIVEWGSAWTVQYVNVSGSKGADGANATNEYTTGTISSVSRDHTWIWGTGTRNGSGLGTCSEGCLVTLGDGVTQNSTETSVAVGSEYTNAYSFSVYTMTHPDLAVGYRFKPDGDATGTDFAVTVDTFTNTHARFGWVYNGLGSTQGGYHPRSRFWARFTDNSTVTISRGHDGNAFPAWVQAVDFSALDE